MIAISESQTLSADTLADLAAGTRERQANVVGEACTPADLVADGSAAEDSAVATSVVATSEDGVEP